MTELHVLEKTDSFEIDLNRIRQDLSATLWQSYWCDTLVKTPFCHPINPPNDEGSSAAATLTLNPTHLYRWDLHEFPPQLPTLSITERHEECMVFWRSLGPDLYSRVVEKTYDVSFSKLIDEVADLEGVDVYWSGHATSSVSNNQTPIAIPSKSVTRFGSLRVCRFPFTAEFHFDDVLERTTFSLASSIADDAFELLVADLQLLLDENRSQQVVLKRNARKSLRCLSENEAQVEIRVNKTFGYAYLSGKMSVKSNESRNAGPQCGFNVRLLDSKVVKTKGFVCECLIATGDLPLQELLGQSPCLDVQSKIILSIIEAIPEKQLSQFFTKYDAYKSKEKAEYARKVDILDSSFYVDVFANADVALDRLFELISEKYPNLDKIFSSQQIQNLIAYRTAISYLDRCSKPEVYWYNFWLQLSKNKSGWIPNSVSCNPEDLDSILYKCSQIKALDDLEALGFQRSDLDAEPFVSFWARLKLIQSKVFYKNVNYLNEAITSVRLEASRCEFIDAASRLIHVDSQSRNRRSLDSTFDQPLEAVDVKIAISYSDEIDDTLNDIIVQDLFKPEGTSDDDLEDGYDEVQEMDDQQNPGEQNYGTDLQDNNTKRPTIRSSKANNIPRRKTFWKRISGYESDADDMKMKFTLNRVKSLAASSTRANSLRSQLELKDEEYRRSLNLPIELDVVLEEDPTSNGMNNKDDKGGKVGEDNPDTKRSRDSDDWKSDGSSKSESSSDSEEEPFGVKKAAFKVPHLKIDDAGSDDNFIQTLKQKSPSNKSILSSPVARVHQLEMRRRTRRSTVLETVLNVVVPQCGPGRS